MAVWLSFSITVISELKLVLKHWTMAGSSWIEGRAIYMGRLGKTGCILGPSGTLEIPMFSKPKSII